MVKEIGPLIYDQPLSEGIRRYFETKDGLWLTTTWISKSSQTYGSWKLLCEMSIFEI